MTKKNYHGTGVGHGHGSNSRLPTIIAIDMPLHVSSALPAGTKAYKLRGCHIFLTPPTPECGWVLSISHPHRYPTWDEVAKARYDLVPDEVTMAMMLPSREKYINIANYCFILNQIFPEEMTR